MTPQHRLLGQSALQAFRADIIPGSADATSDDQSAILVATLLRQSLAAQDDSTASRVQDEAVGIARRSLGEEMLSEGCTYDDHSATSKSDVIRLLAQRTDHSGRFHLAQHLLESTAEIETDPIESGRILSDRAKMSRKLGHLDLAWEQNQKLLHDGNQIRSGELVAKAHYGLGALAETRGNFVEYRMRVRAVVRIARSHRLRNLYAGGLSGLGTSNAMAGRYGDAVANFWKAYQLTGGKGQISRTALGNLSQTLLVSGRPAEARKVATVVMQESQALMNVLPSLGTFAISSAQLGDSEGVRWAASQIELLSDSPAHQREIAEASMECSAALEAIGEKRRGTAMKHRAEAIATHYGFHNLTFREAMLSVQRVVEQPRFTAAGEKVAAAIEELEVPRIPELVAALPA